MITKEKAQEISVDAIYDFTRKMKDVKPDALMILGTFQVRDGLDISECAVNAVSGDTAKMLNCLVNSAQQIAAEIGAQKGTKAKCMFYFELVRRLDMVIRAEDDDN